MSYMALHLMFHAHTQIPPYFVHGNDGHLGHKPAVPCPSSGGATPNSNSIGTGMDHSPNFLAQLEQIQTELKPPDSQPDKLGTYQPSKLHASSCPSKTPKQPQNSGLRVSQAALLLGNLAHTHIYIYIYIGLRLLVTFLFSSKKHTYVYIHIYIYIYIHMQSICINVYMCVLENGYTILAEDKHWGRNPLHTSHLSGWLSNCITFILVVEKWTSSTMRSWCDVPWIMGYPFHLHVYCMHICISIQMDEKHIGQYVFINT